MKPEAQRIAIAEACGLTRLWSTALPIKTVHCDIPDYLNDLNAMHEAEMALNSSDKFNIRKYREKLRAIILRDHWEDDVPEDDSDVWLFCASATERAEAFLRALGKWTEG